MVELAKKLWNILIRLVSHRPSQIISQRHEKRWAATSIPPKKPIDNVHLMNNFCDFIREEVNTFRISHPVTSESVMRLYEKSDAFLKPIILADAGNNGLRCSEGCSHCCKTNNILVSYTETMAILDFIENKMNPILMV